MPASAQIVIQIASVRHLGVEVTMTSTASVTIPSPLAKIHPHDLEETLHLTRTAILPQGLGEIHPLTRREEIEIEMKNRTEMSLRGARRDQEGIVMRGGYRKQMY